MAWAAKLRIATAVMRDAGDLHRKPSTAQAETERWNALAHWAPWYHSCFASCVYRAVEDARKAQVSAPHGVQERCLYNMVRSTKALKVDVIQRIRHKLHRWKQPVPPGIASRRFHQRLHELQCHVPPRVLAALWRTAWNGWCTAARFQRDAPCVFRCSAGARARIEHYACCPFTRWVAYKQWGIANEQVQLSRILLVADGMPTEQCIRYAILAFTIYKVTNAYRRVPPIDDNQVRDSLEDVIKLVCKDVPSEAKQ